MSIEQQLLNRINRRQPRRVALLPAENDQQVQHTLAMGLSGTGMHEFPLGSGRTARKPAPRQPLCQHAAGFGAKRQAVIADQLGNTRNQSGGKPGLSKAARPSDGHSWPIR